MVQGWVLAWGPGVGSGVGSRGAFWRVVQGRVHEATREGRVLFLSWWENYNQRSLTVKDKRGGNASDVTLLACVKVTAMEKILHLRPKIDLGVGKSSFPPPSACAPEPRSDLVVQRDVAGLAGRTRERRVEAHCACARGQRCGWRQLSVAASGGEPAREGHVRHDRGRAVKQRHHLGGKRGQTREAVFTLVPSTSRSTSCRIVTSNVKI